MSCKNEHDPPYQATVYINFQMPQVNSVKDLREVAADMIAHGWKEAPTTGEHFGRKLTKDSATAIFYRNTEDLDYGTMWLYGECRNMTNHRNDNPAWTELADELRPIRGWCRESLIRRQCWNGLQGSPSERHATSLETGMTCDTGF